MISISCRRRNGQMPSSFDAPTQVVAIKVGYHDASFVGRLFGHKVDATSAQNRKHSYALRNAMKGSAS